MPCEKPYIDRTYRRIIAPRGLTCYRVAIRESDLYVCTRGDLHRKARESLEACRSDLEAYIEDHPRFKTTFRPYPVEGSAAGIVKDMGRAAEIFNVGPMSSVAGAIAQHVGSDMLEYSPEVIVENGGDIFMAGGKRRRVRVFAGVDAPSVEIIVEDSPEGVGLCTSSAGVGPSVSLGMADAVTVLSRTATLADAAATALGNLVRSPDDVENVLRAAGEMKEVLGVMIIAGDRVGWRGALEIA